MDTCRICEEEEATQQHETHGLVCSGCYEDLDNIEHDYQTTQYEKNIQEQIDAEPDIDCSDD